MAFRIHDSVARGEIDNRTKGIVRGTIWLEGSPEPLILELTGNAHPDLAGCLLTFTNGGACYADSRLERLTRKQRGVAGDLTASRKARVLDLPATNPLPHPTARPTRQHLANALYLEWFSETNGRVVLESADYQLKISPPEWQLTPEEDEQRARDAAAGMDNFLAALTRAIEQHQRQEEEDPEKPWDEHKYERFLRESDARTEKYGELLDKYGDSDEAEAKIAKEMGWDRELPEEQAEERAEWIEEMNRACEEAFHEPEPEPDPHREGIDWIRTPDGELHHPLQYLCFENAMSTGTCSRRRENRSSKIPMSLTSALNFKPRA